MLMGGANVREVPIPKYEFRLVSNQYLRLIALKSPHSRFLPFLTDRVYSFAFGKSAKLPMLEFRL